jgi:hypothetical protein
MSHLKRLLKSGSVYFLRQTRWPRVAGRRENLRSVGSRQSGVVQDDDSSRFQAARTDLPVLPRDFVVMIAVNVDAVPLVGGNELECDGFRRVRLNQRRLRQREMHKVCKRVLKIIHIRPVFADRIAGGSERGYSRGDAFTSEVALQHRRQRKRLAAVNANFQKALKLEFAKEQKPHHMKSILTESPSLSAEVNTMSAKFRGQVHMKVAKAF